MGVDRERERESTAQKREIAMQTFEMIYCKLSEYYGSAVSDGWAVIFNTNTVCIYGCMCHR